MKLSAIRKSSGFTLVELLIVIAVIAVLAAVILAVVNPVQQLARGRDAGRISTISQLGSALQRYATSNTDYPAVPGSGNGTFMTDLQNGNEISSVFTNPNYGGGITAGCEDSQHNQNGFCYDSDTNGTIVYARAESDANNALCPSATPVAWIVWSSEAGRSGITCTANATTVPATSGLTFVN